MSPRPPSPSASVLDGTTAMVMQDVGKRFGSTEAPAVLQGFSLAVQHGEFVALLGPSGCGKTTLLRIIQGLEHASDGTVIASARREGAKPRMRYVFQRASLLPWYTVRKNVAFGVTVRSARTIYANPTERDAAVDELLELIGLTQYANYYPDQISGGMQQRVNLARALAARPDVLLLDEPFSALDALTRERLQVDVSEIVRTLGTTALLVTHDIREAAFMGDRVVVMGRDPGNVQEIFEIDSPRPRSAEFQHGIELAEIENRIWKVLSKQ